MIKSRTAQLIYQSFYCAIGLVAIVASIGIFDDIANLKLGFYVYFTNVSNYFCIAVMLAQLVQTARKKEDSCVTVAPFIKFIGLLSILLTFVIFNFILANAPGRDPQLNWRIASLSLHVVLPVMYVADWFLFCEHGKLKWFHPIASTIFPLIYVILVFVRAAILRFDSSAPDIYPYFFLNLSTQGVGGVIKWVLIILAAFVIAGYIFFGIDKLIKSKK